MEVKEMRIRTLAGVVLGVGIVCGVACAENAEFFRQLREKEEVTTLLDGYRVALAVLDNENYTDVPFQTAREKLLAAGIIPERWAAQEDATLTRGKMAFILVKALGIKGGITMRLFGVSERYALKECNFEELMAAGMTWRSVSGRELVAILARADEYKADQAKKGRVDVRPVETPEE